MRLTSRDKTRLNGVHPDLVRVVYRAASDPDCPHFVVLEGTRSVARQRKLVAKGASKTMNSRHIPAPNGYGHAVDIAPLIDGKVSWDWPLYHKLAPHVKRAADREDVPIEWGGDWRSFKDGPHWQLPWTQYPGRTDPRVARSERYTDLTDAQDRNRRVAYAVAGATTSGTIGADPAATAVDAIVQQQNELSSGDVVRLVIAAIIVGLTLWLAFRKVPS